MKSFSLARQLINGCLLSLFAATSIAGFSLFTNPNQSFYWGFSATMILYVGLILKNSSIKAGHLSMVICFILGCFVTLLLAAESQLVLFFNLTGLFLLRVVFYQSTLTEAAIDAVLIGIGFLSAAGVLVVTGSWFLCFWCFFFVQAFQVYSASFFADKRKIKTEQSVAERNNQKFSQARNTADQALSQLANHSFEI